MEAATILTRGEVDLVAVHQELVTLEEQISIAKQKHNEFLKELGLSLLP